MACWSLTESLRRLTESNLFERYHDCRVDSVAVLNDGDAPELSANQAEDIHDAAAAEMKTAKCLSIENIANLALDDAQPEEEEEEAECFESDSNGTDDEAAEKE